MSKFYVFGITKAQTSMGLEINLENTACKIIMQHPELSLKEMNNVLIYSADANGEYFSKTYVKECLYKYLQPAIGLSPIEVVDEDDVPKNASIVLKP